MERDMKLQILISTCNERIFDVVKRLPVFVENLSYIIIHQVFDGKTYNTLDKFISSRSDVKYVLTNTRGLSVSRNLALKMATGDVVLISDDDVRFDENIYKKIILAYDLHENADAITFKISTGMCDYKSYCNFTFKHSWKSLFSVSSIEITAKLDSIRRYNLFFDERFGLGAEYPSSEENIFLLDLKKLGMNIFYHPEIIVYHPDESSGKSWIKKEQFLAKGALFYRQGERMSV